MEQREGYHDVELTTADGKLVQWRESEIHRVFPSLLSSVPIRRSQRRITLLVEIPICSFTVEIMKQFCQTNKIVEDLSFAEYEYLLKCILIIPPDEHLPLQNFIFSILMKNIESYNCIGIWMLAKKYRNELYIGQSKKHILENIFEYCKCGTIDFHFYGRLSKQDVIDIVSDDNLNIQTEEDVIIIILAWIDALPNERNGLLKELLCHVRKEGLSKTLEEISSVNESISIAQLNLSLKPSREFKDKLVILGGHVFDGKKDDITSSMEYYDLVENKWLKLNNLLPYASSYHATQFFENNLYLFGGTSLQSAALSNCWKFMNGSWVGVASMNQKRTYITQACCVLDGEIYVIGGHDGRRRESTEVFPAVNTRLKSVEKYDVHADEWTTVSELNYGRSDAACTVFNDRIYVFGGFDGNRILDSIEMYVPSLDSWIVIDTKLPSPRSGMCCASFDERIWIIGGSEYNQKHSTVFSFQPKKDIWIIENELNVKRSNFTIATMGRRFVVMGGYYKKILNSVETLYNNEWHVQDIASLNHPKSALASVIIPYSYFKVNFQQNIQK
ncbi:unnamed protein product [Auanema sp. JU1783]|nr:unnamed protein product [Auanema sp. JU1783]